MGMSASQGKLLFITARLSNNEFEQQQLAYSKQRLANNTERINDEYLAAMEKTKYQVLTGYNGTEAKYEDLTYNQLTGMNNVALGKQYIVKDAKNKVVVPKSLANAFEKGNGDFNVFLASVGYTQSDIDISNDSTSLTAMHEAWDKYLNAVGKSIDDYNSEHILDFGFNSTRPQGETSAAFDGYITYDTAYITHDYNDGDDETFQMLNLYNDHELTYDSAGKIIGDTNNYYVNNYVIFPKEYTDENGNTNAILCFQTEEQAKNDEYTYFNGIQLTSYNSKTGEYKCTFGDNTYDKLYVVIDPNNEGQVYITPDYRSMLEKEGDGEYYLHFTDAMTGTGAKVDGAYELHETSKPLTYEGSNQIHRDLYEYAVSITASYANRDNPSYNNLKHDDSATAYYKHIFTEMRMNGYTTISDETDFKDTNWFVTQLKAGKINISYYSNVDEKFIGTTLDDDESIVEKEDKSAIAVAEQTYTSRMNRIESQDKQFDMQLSKLEAEHSALSTEYEAVVKVISKNIEKSFNIFS